MKVAVYTIALNEAQHVKRWASSVHDADIVCFADTGSTDDTLKLARKALRSQRAKFSSISISPWRFEDAHNASLALVPADIDVCIPLHLDEMLMPGWRKALERGWLPGTTKCFYPYVFSHHPDGTPELEFLQNRIHARRGYRWKYPDHEGVYPYDILERSVTIPDLRIEQWADRTKDRSGILLRLSMGVKENPNDPRMAYYFGRELMYYGQYHAALQHLERYLTIPQPPFPYERNQVLECIATCQKALGTYVAPPADVLPFLTMSS